MANTHESADETGSDLPPDKKIRMWGEICSSGLWATSGLPIFPEDLPISDALRARLERWAQWYDDVEWIEAGKPWEASPGTPVAAFNHEGRLLAQALKTELGPEWHIIAFDVDGWCHPADDRAHRRLELLPTLP